MVPRPHGLKKEKEMDDAMSLDGLRIVGTRKAAEVLGRKQQTLRGWACDGSGPVRPVKVGGRLGWRVADLERVLRGETVAVTQ